MKIRLWGGTSVAALLCMTAWLSAAPAVTPVTGRARLKKNGCGTLPLIGTSRESLKRVTEAPTASARQTR